MDEPFPSYAHAYLNEICDRLERGDRTPAEKARAVIALWKRQPRVNPKLWQAWERLLEGPAAAIRASVLAEGEAAQELRHSHPFAGIFTNLERAALRRRYPGLSH